MDKVVKVITGIERGDWEHLVRARFFLRSDGFARWAEFLDLEVVSVPPPPDGIEPTDAEWDALYAEALQN